MRYILAALIAGSVLMSANAFARHGSACGEDEVPIRKCFYDESGGRPCICGMRITVESVYLMLLDATGDEILADFPYLEREDLLAAVEYMQQRLDIARENSCK